MIYPSGSSIARAIVCPASTALPRVSRRGGAPQERGIALHAYLANIKAMGKEAALEAVPQQWRLFCQSVPVEELGLGSFEAEVALAYDPLSGLGRVLGTNIERSYLEHGWNKEKEIPCTPDGLGVSDDAVLILDWKTGRTPVAAPAGNWQMILAALAACSIYDRTKAELRIVHIQEGKAPWVESATLDVLDLMAAQVTLQGAIAKWALVQEDYEKGHIPNVVAGDHCKFCECVAACPSTAGAMVRFLAMTKAPNEQEDLVQLKARLLETLDDDTARQARETMVRMQAVLDTVDSALRAYSTTNPVPMGNGKVYGVKLINIEEFSPTVVYDIVKEAHGEELAAQSVVWETSKARLNGVAKILAAKKGTSIKAELEELLEVVRRRGGSSFAAQERYEIYRPTQVVTD